MNRRSLLSTLLAGSLAGCVGRATPSDTQPRQERTDEGIPPCGEDLVRLPLDLREHYDVRNGSAAGFSLDVSPSSLQMEDEVTFALVNESEERATTGTRQHYTIQRETDDGWEHVVWIPDRPFVHRAVGAFQDPGEGFEWTFTFSRAGLETEEYRVCEPLTAGTYRFVYVGLVGPDDPAVAREFEVRGG